AGKDQQLAGLDDVVVPAALEIAAAQLDHAHAPPRRAEAALDLLQRHHAMHGTLQLVLAAVRRQVVQQQHRGARVRQALAQGDDLASIVGAVARQQPYLHHGIDDDARRARLVDAIGDVVDERRQFGLGRQQDRLRCRLVRRQRQCLDNLDAVEVPAMVVRRRAQFDLGLRQRQVQAAVALLDAFDQVAQPERRLAGARPAFDQVDALAQQAAAQDGVEFGDAGNDTGEFRCHVDLSERCLMVWRRRWHVGCHPNGASAID
ncbi:conserved hypothetical protein, partial [Ricinus communis]